MMNLVRFYFGRLAGGLLNWQAVQEEEAMTLTLPHSLGSAPSPNRWASNRTEGAVL
jgi:hypothetical protein